MRLLTRAVESVERWTFYYFLLNFNNSNISIDLVGHQELNELMTRLRD